LLEIAGQPLILWVAQRACAASTISRTIVATDDPRIVDAVNDAGFDAAITRADHATGTDRIAEVAHNLRADIIVNVQGDEPLIDPATIDRAVQALIDDPTAQMSTTCEPIDDAVEVLNPSVVKVTIDEQGYANGFSHNPIPFPNEAVRAYGSLEAALRQEPALLFSFRKHTGLYAYRRDFLLRLAELPRAPIECIENLEQLRILHAGHHILVGVIDEPTIGIDTPDDYRQFVARKSLGH